MENITIEEKEINEKLEEAIKLEEEIESENLMEKPIEKEIIEIKELEKKESKIEDNKEEFIFNKDKYKDKSTEELTQELEKAQKATHYKQKIIGRQSQEVYEARLLQQKVENLQIELNKIKENEIDYYDDPEQHVQNKIKEKEITEELNKTNIINNIISNKNLVLNKIPEFEDLVNEISEIAKEDGIPENHILAFKNNPYADSPEILITYAKRAQDRIKTKQIELKLKELETKPNKNIKNLDKITNSQPIINSKSISDSNHYIINNGNLSEDQLNKLIQQKYHEEWGE